MNPLYPAGATAAAAAAASSAPDKNGERVVVVDGGLGEAVVINASGHKQELRRQFGFWSACAVGITTGNTWCALAGTLSVALYNGGSPGVIYEFIAVSVFYWLIAASIAELASAIPSSSGVYHWAFATAGRYGRPVAFFAGHWNFFAWLLAASSVASIVGNMSVSMYAMFRPEFEPQPWHVFVAYICITWICCGTVLFANRILPFLSALGGITVIVGVFITILVCAIMPSTNDQAYATTSAVWTEWDNQTGYTSNGFVFLLGMLNGAFAVGTPDCISHLAEEMPTPTRTIPLSILFQFLIGFSTSLPYLIALFYAAPSIPALLAASNTSFPLAPLYVAATGSTAGGAGLMAAALVPSMIGGVGCFVTAGRTWWTLARDNAVPGSRLFRQVSPRWGNPFAATLWCGALTSLLGVLYVGNTTAFAAFVGSFVVMTTLSYTAAVLHNILTARSRTGRGWFWMPGWAGWAVNAVAVAYMLVFVVVFCFPVATPVAAASMNYSCLIAGGWTVLVAAFWVVRRGEYKGPPVVVVAAGGAEGDGDGEGVRVAVGGDEKKGEKKGEKD